MPQARQKKKEHLIGLNVKVKGKRLKNYTSHKKVGQSISFLNFLFVKEFGSFTLYIF